LISILNNDKMSNFLLEQTFYSDKIKENTFKYNKKKDILVYNNKDDFK